MTIQRGQAWGRSVPRPHEMVAASSDAELAALATADPAGTYTVIGGDLFRSLGSPTPGEQVQRLPVDALVVLVDERELIAVAHVVVRRSWWRGPLLAVMNCDHVGAWNVAPRAHPNDGRFDIVEVSSSMPARDRWQARSRLPLGTHVPHPDIGVRVAAQADWTFERPVPVEVDGVRRGRATRLRVRVSPDHFAIHV